jgi:hypothetical protein
LGGEKKKLRDPKEAARIAATMQLQPVYLRETEQYILLVLMITSKFNLFK